MDFYRDEHRVHLIVYHLIWTPKRRKSVLTGKIAKDLETIMRDTAENNKFEIIELAIEPDHVHVFVRTWPTISPYEVVKKFKGSSSGLLRRKHKELLKLPSLWSRSYLVSTAGNVSAKVVKKYIQAQGKT